MSESTSRRRPEVILGVLLIAAGIVFLVAQQAGLTLGDLGWPLYVIIPGVVLLIAAVAVGGPAAVGLAIAGSIVTTTGVILAVQDATGLYETWAYAWALLAPGAVGIGMVIGGLVNGDGEIVRNGVRTFLIGLVLFGAFALFFEGLIGLSGGRFPGLDTLLAIVLIVAGIGVIGVSLFGRRRPA